jgi:hypothetical protein
MKLAIVGSRDINNFNTIEEKIKSNYNIGNIQVIISGGAKGVDQLAEIFAQKYNKELKIFYPDWNIYGAKAAFIRNTLICENSDQIVAFWDGKSKGTKMTIDIANRLGKLIKV